MMSIKKRLALTSFLILGTVMISITGVISATSLSFSIQNSIAFTATSIETEISIVGQNAAQTLPFYENSFTTSPSEEFNQPFELASSAFAGAGEENAIEYTILIKNLGSLNVEVEFGGLMVDKEHIVLQEKYIIEGTELGDSDNKIIYANETLTVKLKYILQDNASEEVFDLDLSCALNPTFDNRES